MTPEIIKGLMNSCLQEDINNITKITFGYDGSYVSADVYYNVKVTLNGGINPVTSTMSAHSEFVYMYGDWILYLL